MQAGSAAAKKKKSGGNGKGSTAGAERARANAKTRLRLGVRPYTASVWSAGRERKRAWLSRREVWDKRSHASILTDKLIFNANSRPNPYP